MNTRQAIVQTVICVQTQLTLSHFHKHRHARDVKTLRITKPAKQHQTTNILSKTCLGVTLILIGFNISKSEILRLTSDFSTLECECIVSEFGMLNNTYTISKTSNEPLFNISPLYNFGSACREKCCVYSSSVYRPSTRQECP